MTRICDFCKKPVSEVDNQPMTFGSTTLDFHKNDCHQKFIDRIVGGISAPPIVPFQNKSPPPPQPKYDNTPIRPKHSFWGFKKNKPPKAPQYGSAESEEELAGAFGK